MLGEAHRLHVHSKLPLKQLALCLHRRRCLCDFWGFACCITDWPALLKLLLSAPWCGCIPHLHAILSCGVLEVCSLNCVDCGAALALHNGA